MRVKMYHMDINMLTYLSTWKPELRKCTLAYGLANVYSCVKTIHIVFIIEHILILMVDKSIQEFISNHKYHF